MLPAAGDMQSAALTLFSTYASFAGSMMLIRSMANELVPSPVRTYLQSVIHSFFSKHITVKVHEHLNGGMIRNQIYDAAEVYLHTKISPDTKRFSIGKTPKQKSISISLEKGEEILDRFGDDMELRWTMSIESQKNYGNEKRLFELTFNKKFMDRVLKDYVPFVLAKSKEITDKDEKVVKLYTRASIPGDDDGPGGGYRHGGGGRGGWGSINLDHPATFETLAMDPELKKAIIDDLDRFLKRKDFYRKLTSLCFNSELRKILVSTTNRSILVIEDVDCSVEMQDRRLGVERPNDRRNKIEGLIEKVEVTPAEVAEELMKSEDVDIALAGVVNLLKRKKMEGNEIEEVEGCETKRFKIEEIGGSLKETVEEGLLGVGGKVNVR
ncbi:hypothetical protein RHSIM_Rhsim02G0006300 [Rhododendron simsii]|uniref:AAA-type ATPase N-terminal domain-containing protein n=1 Tax=Rhododendron simsii TaxID=118357 RepID=A0A834HM00_RHOSS|nr:hypothetical protein RHSIM_Rhsim02G0006300 [Rhododendron simsii]